MNRFFAIIGYAFRDQKLLFLLTAVFTALFLADLAPVEALSRLRQWWQGGFDIHPTLATLLVALAVWFGETRDNWLNDLPKKMTVTFWLDARELMVCRCADLANAGDMRALAQQIGMQMAGVQKLSFIAAMVSQDGGKVERQGDGSFIRHYQVQFILTAMPSELPEGVQNRTHILLWEPPFKLPIPPVLREHQAANTDCSTPASATERGEV